MTRKDRISCIKFFVHFRNDERLNREIKSVVRNFEDTHVSRAEIVRNLWKTFFGVHDYYNREDKFEMMKWLGERVRNVIWDFSDDFVVNLGNGKYKINE